MYYFNKNTIQLFFNIFFNIKKYYNNNVRFIPTNNVRLILFIFIIYLIKINKTLLLLLFYFLILFIIFWLISTLNLTYLLIIKKNKINKIKNLSIIKDWEFINLKNNIKSSIIPVKFTSHQVRKFSTSSVNQSAAYLSSTEMKIKQLKDFKKAYGGGFLGYTHIYNFGNISQFTYYKDNLEYETCKSVLKSKLIDYISVIPETETYSVLPVLRWEYSGGEYRSLTISESVKINKNININLLAESIIWDIKNMFNKYTLLEGDLELYIMGRPWLSVDEFDLDRFFDRKNLADHLDEVLEKKLSAHSKSFNNPIEKGSPDKISGLKNYLYKNIYMDNYGEPVLDLNKNLIGYKLNNSQYISIKTFYNENNLLCNNVSIRDFDANNLTFKPYILREWTDIKTDTGFIREFNKNKYYYDKNNNIVNVESTYTYPSFHLIKNSVKLDSKIGTLDFETYGSNFGMGYQQVYAGGWAIEGETQLFYITYRETSDQFINRIFKSIIMNKNLNGYTFYAHNLGRFDSVFILKSLIRDSDIELTPIWKDNAILYLTLKYGDFKITILDSLQLISGSLKDILISFGCDTQKGYFPYSFVNNNNLYYIGDKPSKEHFKNITDLEYQTIPKDNWNLKKNTLLYLKSDLEGLLEALTKFKNNIYSKYKLNITKFKTLPGLTLAAYLSSYLPDNLKSELKIIKGGLEKEIRRSYFGGDVDVFINEVSNGYLYDINSQYSKAMLNDMPVGDPILSLETDLNKIFGFVYGEITAPEAEVLRVPIIQYKDPIKKITTCPRGKFKRLIFSQEIKYALKLGYKIDIEYCYQFKRGKGLFDKYVIEHYNEKKNSSDQVQRSISKLFLNSLYGRFGMKEIENFIKIVDQNEAEYLDKTTNVTILSKLTDNKYMVRYKGNISDSLRKLYTKDPFISVEGQMINYTKGQLKKIGLNKKTNVPSAVHIAAAISSYARIIINEYKNIPGNPCVMSDTDSAVLPYPLPSHLVGNELGQMKLVSKIKHGIFIKKKFYCILDSNNQEIIKTSGIDSSRLNYEAFIKLLNGETVTVDRTSFNLDWEERNINVVKSEIIIQGLTNKIKTIYNTKDTNFKYISFPIKYNIIVHPLGVMFNHPPIVDKVDLKLDKFNVNKFSNLEIFIYFIFILSYLSLITLFLYKIY